MTTQKDERILYNLITNTVMGWIEEQNKKGKKPRQSTIVGSLDMVKTDIYNSFVVRKAIRIAINDFLNEWKGKEITIDRDGSVTIIAQREKEAA